MTEIDGWVAEFVKRLCPSCGRPVTTGKRHGLRATCGSPACIARCRGNGKRCPRCGKLRRVGQDGKLLQTCGDQTCVRYVMAQSLERAMPKDLPRDMRACRCGAKLSFVVDMYGQTYEQCDRCKHRAAFGRHPIAA